MIYKKTTIKDVALAAGVSTQTISRVLNNRPDVSAETRNRILQIIAKLNYSPSALARRMRRNRDTSEYASNSLNLNSDLAALSSAADEVCYKEMRTIIDRALASALTHEKASWLLEGFEKGFLAEGGFVHLPVAQNENHNKSVGLEQSELFLLFAV